MLSQNSVFSPLIEGDHTHVIIVHTLMMYVRELIENMHKVLMNCLPDDHGTGDIIIITVTHGHIILEYNN